MMNWFTRALVANSTFRRVLALNLSCLDKAPQEKLTLTRTCPAWRSRNRTLHDKSQHRLTG